MNLNVYVYLLLCLLLIYKIDKILIIDVGLGKIYIHEHSFASMEVRTEKKKISHYYLESRLWL